MLFRSRPPPTFDALGAVFLRLLCLAGTADFIPAASLWSSVLPPGVELADNGLGGRLGIRPTCFGGWGKAPMLTVLRRDLPCGSGPAAESVVVMLGTVEGELVRPLGDGRCGSADEEAARIAEAGEASTEPDEVRETGLELEARDLGTGSEGSGPVGGAIEDREGRGSVGAVMLCLCGFRVSFIY